MADDLLSAYAGVAADVGAQVREARLDHAAFERRVRACELERCRATCCHDGVCLSDEEAGGIAQLLEDSAEVLAGYGLALPEEALIGGEGAWKTALREAQAGELAEDFPAHFPPTRCVFLDPVGRCALQLLSVQEGHHPWFFKPLTCWIHPLALRPINRRRQRPELTLHSAQDDPQRQADYPGFASCTHCGREDRMGLPARLVLAAELRGLSLLAGRDLLGELNAAAATP